MVEKKPPTPCSTAAGPTIGSPLAKTIVPSAAKISANRAGSNESTRANTSRMKSGLETGAFSAISRPLLTRSRTAFRVVPPD